MVRLAAAILAAVALAAVGHVLAPARVPDSLGGIKILVAAPPRRVVHVAQRPSPGRPGRHFQPKEAR